jgi:hypothetical protein
MSPDLIDRTILMKTLDDLRQEQGQLHQGLNRLEDKRATSMLSGSYFKVLRLTMDLKDNLWGL